MGKMVNGICDNLLVTTYLSARCPVFVAPAMDLDMFQHPSTLNNMTTLKSWGCHIIEPASGALASGLEGKGRMEEPEVIVQRLQDWFAAAEKKSRRALSAFCLLPGRLMRPLIRCVLLAIILRGKWVLHWLRSWQPGAPGWSWFVGLCT